MDLKEEGPLGIYKIFLKNKIVVYYNRIQKVSSLNKMVEFESSQNVNFDPSQFDLGEGFDLLS